MSTAAYAVRDSATMLRRNLRRTLRYPASAAATVGIPIIFLLLFVFVLGDTLGAGLDGVSGGRDEYLDYVTPGILGPLEWVAAVGLLMMVTYAVIWLAVALGLVSKSVETASNLPMPLIILPFLGSGFVPTDSMPAAMRWFAENQPFTPIMETLRGLLMGTPIGSSGLLAVAWSVGAGLASYLWAKRLFNRDPTPI
jgi:ABC-type Na+ efflux pump permease subunit